MFRVLLLFIYLFPWNFFLFRCLCYTFCFSLNLIIPFEPNFFYILIQLDFWSLFPWHRTSHISSQRSDNCRQSSFQLISILHVFHCFFSSPWNVPLFLWIIIIVQINEKNHGELQSTLELNELKKKKHFFKVNKLSRENSLRIF